jgi:hypothetical protein
MRKTTAAVSFRHIVFIVPMAHLGTCLAGVRYTSWESGEQKARDRSQEGFCLRNICDSRRLHLGKGQARTEEHPNQKELLKILNLTPR